MSEIRPGGGAAAAGTAAAGAVPGCSPSPPGPLGQSGEAPAGVASVDRRIQPSNTVINGELLQQARVRHGLSQAELSREARVGMPTVLRLERPQLSACRTRTAVRLANALEEHLATLIPAEQAVALRLVPAGQGASGAPAAGDPGGPSESVPLSA
jgi:hypothetical protein